MIRAEYYVFALLILFLLMMFWPANVALRFSKWLARHPKLALIFTWIGGLWSIWYAMQRFDLIGLILMISGWAILFYMSIFVYIPAIRGNKK